MMFYILMNLFKSNEKAVSISYNCLGFVCCKRH